MTDGGYREELLRKELEEATALLREILASETLVLEHSDRHVELTLQRALWERVVAWENVTALQGAAAYRSTEAT